MFRVYTVILNGKPLHVIITIIVESEKVSR